MGNRTQMTDATGTTTYGYDIANRLTGVSRQGSTVGYQYDAMGNRTRLTYPDGRTLTYAYDNVDRLKTLTVSGNGAYTYSYANHRLDKLTRPNGQSTDYGYDAAGRLDNLTHQVGGQTLANFAYVLDKTGNIVETIESFPPPPIYLPIIFKNGVPAFAANPVVAAPEVVPVPENVAPAPVDESTFSSPLAAPLPDPSPTTEPAPTPTTDPVSLDRLRAEVDTAFNNSDLSDKLHQELLKLLDKAARATDKGHTDDAIAELEVFSFTLLSQRDLNASPAAADLLIELAKQLIEQWQAQASLVRPSGLASPLFTPVGPTVDGGTLSLLPLSLSQGATSRTINYTYDKLYRLTDAVYSTGESLRYTYDPRGNRLTQQAPGGNTTYVYDAANRLTSVNGQPYTWDNNGNLLSDGSRAYTYDTANRLISVTDGGVTTQFEYNGDGDRTAQIVGGVRTDYVLDPLGLAQVLVETGGGQSIYYVPRLAQQTAAGWQYFVPDRLGSVRQITDPTGELLLAQSFDPFGNVFERSGTGSSTFGYTGEQTDPTDLVFLRARYYSPEIGRFLTADSIVPEPLSSVGWNRYAYVGNNPIRYTDPSGHCVDPVSGTACLLAATKIAVEATLLVGAIYVSYELNNQLDHQLPSFPVVAPDFGPQPGFSLSQCPDPAGYPNPMLDVGAYLGGQLTFPSGNIDSGLQILDPPHTTLEFPPYFTASDGTPRKNYAQNKQFKGAVREIEKRIGRRLSKDEQSELHREISGQNYGYHEIVETGIGLFGYR